MAFEELKNYREGELWRRLLNVYPTPLAELERDPFFISMNWPRVIYHYTTVIGLQGILESNRVWASAAYYLNDSSEIEYGCKLVRDALALWQHANKQNPCFAADALGTLENVFANPVSRVSWTTTIYVACFCENDNLLSQWRAYGQTGGYSLGFDIQRGTMALTVPGSFWDLRLAKVVYDSKIQRERIHSLLRQALVAISDPSLDTAVGNARVQLLREAVLYIQELLLDDVVVFKNSAFEEESEWRLIVRPSLIRSREVQTPTTEPTRFKFRHSRGGLVPYLDLVPQKEKIPLRSIRFGPSLEPNRTEHSVGMLLASCGFKGVEVKGSEIPVIL